jgi:hypothetical protein
MNYETINTINYNAEYNEDLDGFIITFKDGKTAQTQFDVQTNRLHADFDQRYLTRYREYDDELSIEQEEMVDNFVADNQHLS